MPSGATSNGFSLIRKILEVSGADLEQDIDGSTLGRALLEPTRIYVKPILHLLTQCRIKALSHITGGGLLENLPRVLPQNCNAVIDTNSWDLPAVFHWLQQAGNVETLEMYRTFNCGVGMVLCLAAADSDLALATLREAGEDAWLIGEIAAGDNQVEFRQ